jgi:hypothetical protein
MVFLTQVMDGDDERKSEPPLQSPCSPHDRTPPMPWRAETRMSKRWTGVSAGHL